MMLLEMAEGGFGDRVAIGDAADGLRFGELLDLVGRVATWLRDHPADRLVFTDATSEMLPIALFASAWAGKPFVPLNYRLADERLQSLISRQAPAAVLCTPGSQNRIGEHPGIDVVATTDLRSAIDDITVCDRDWSYESEAVAILLHTSGTSGDPKIAVLRHRHLVSYVIGSVEFMGADPDEAMLVSVPPYHIAGLAAILTATYAGRRMVQLATFEPTKWVRLAREQNVTHTMVVPTMLARIIEVLDDGDGLPALRHLSYGGGGCRSRSSRRR
jgi:fatty-acyl-CoA synthase